MKYLKKIPKVCEFNFKLLQNIVPCGKICKWQKNVFNACEHCLEIETRHMLYECPRVLEIWNLVSIVINVNLNWKHNLWLSKV